MKRFVGSLLVGGLLCTAGHASAQSAPAAIAQIDAGGLSYYSGCGIGLFHGWAIAGTDAAGGTIVNGAPPGGVCGAPQLPLALGSQTFSVIGQECGFNSFGLFDLPSSTGLRLDFANGAFIQAATGNGNGAVGNAVTQRIGDYDVTVSNVFHYQLGFLRAGRYYSDTRSNDGNVAACGNGWPLANFVTQFTVTVSPPPPPPNVPPDARCKDVIVVADGACQGSASIDDGSADADGNLVGCTQSSAGPFGPGDHAVSLTCTDAEGASSSCSATIHVVDETPPTYAPPGDQCTLASCDGAVAFATGGGADNCGPVAIECSSASGDPLGVGAHAITCAAVDGAGNSSPSASFTVTALAQLDALVQSPLAAAPVGNKFTAGQTLPHKLRLRDHCSGADVTTTAAVSPYLSFTKRDSSNASSIIDLDENTSGVGDGASGLMVLVDGLYQFNLKTTDPDVQAGSIRNSSYYQSDLDVSWNACPALSAAATHVLLETR